ncbi:MAG: ABC transporter permease [Planctomycetia bacterium]|nr:ABC transporter permease [Planctomycetia bacterium]
MVPIKYNIRSLRNRWVSSLMTILGTGLVVWASVLAFGLADGLDHTLAISGDPLDLIVMRKGATSETNSIISESTAREIDTLAGVATDAAGNKLYSSELVVVVNTPRRGEQAGSANLIVRGVPPVGKQVRTGFRIVEGRENKPGLREAITSRTMARRFVGAGLGEKLDIFDAPFEIVGIFEAGGSASESEVWTDLEVLAQATKREGVRSALQIRVNSPDDAATLMNRIENDEQFGLKAVTEPQYFLDQAQAGMAIKIVGRTIAIVLTIGAMFAVANTMYAAVASRAREIGTLRAVGFSRRTVLASFLLESLLLCLAGGAVGCLGALPLNGLSTGTANWATFSELTFSFRFGPAVLAQAVLLAVLMGVIGGLFPAIRATRMKIVDALREI